jgi:biopolymer transport protein ExbD
MRFPHRAKPFRGQLDAAPFLGVFFLLIIFLLLNSSLVFYPGVPIQLPEAIDMPGTDRATAVVAVDATGHFYFENQLCDEPRLKERLQAAVQRSPEPITLIIQSDRQATVGVMVRLAGLARGLGIREVLQAVRPPTESRLATALEEKPQPPPQP